MPAPFYILFGAVFTVAVSLALGLLLLRGLGARLYRFEERILGFVIGSSCLSAIVFLLSALHLARKGVFLATGLSLIALALWRRCHRSYDQCPPDQLDPVPRLWRWLFWAPYTVFGVFYLVHAMAPENSPDGTAYHLAIVGRYHRAHGLEAIPTNMYASLSQGVDLLFLFAYSFGRHSAAAMVHAAYLFALPLALLSFGRRFQCIPAGAGAGILVFASPIFGMDGISAYNDVALACVAFSLFYLLEIGESRLTIPAGLLAGFCYAIKYTGFLAVPYALARILWRHRQWKLTAVAAGCALALIAPWMIKNWIYVQNPLAPFFNEWFPNPHVTAAFEKDYSAFLRHYDVGAKWMIPWELTVRGGMLGGFLGPVWLLAPIGVLALRTPLGRHILTAGAVFGLTYYANIGTRFFLPAAPLLALAAMLVLRRVTPFLLVVHCILSVPPVMRLYCQPTAWQLNSLPWRAALRLESEDHWLSRRTPAYVVARRIERDVPPSHSVLAMNQIPAAYTTREILVGYQSAYGNILREILLTPLMPEVVPTRHLDFHFGKQLLREIRVVQTAGGEPDLWSIGELRLYHQGREVPRASLWRLRASHNPWYVQLAFDSSPLTRWSSAHAILPGMYVSVDFGKLETIDQLVVESATDQYKTVLRVESRDADGLWHPLESNLRDHDIPIVSALRRGAIEELKARGIRFLLISDGDFGWEDFHVKSAAWGISELWEYYGQRLYRLE